MSGQLPKPRQPSQASWSSTRRTVIFVVSTVIAILSGSIGIGGLASVLSGQPLGHGGAAGNVAALLIFAGMTIFFGLVARHQHIQSTSLKEMENERAVLAYAKQVGGDLTVPDVALNCSLGTVDAGKVLNRLTARGVCQMDVSEEGELLYCFNSFKRPHQLEGPSS